MATRRTSDPTPPSPKTSAPPPAKTTRAKSAKASAEPKPIPPVIATDDVRREAKSSGAEIKAERRTEPASATPAATSKPAPARRVAKPKAPKGAAAVPQKVQVDENTRRGMIAESAYLRAERRGFAPGGEEEDWIAAEKEVDALLNATTGSGPQ